VLGDRYPDVDSLQVSSKCKEKAREKVAQWIKQDMADWDQLSNRACSYRTGWVEKVPGTCHAGGPPPLCPVDHWRQDPVAAASAWSKEKREKRAERAEELVSIACDCELAEMVASDAARASNSSSAATRKQSSIVALCNDSRACGAPGLACINGRCTFEDPQWHTVNSTLAGLGGAALEHARDAAIHALIKLISDTASAASESLTAQVITGVFSPSEIGTPNQIYISKAEEVLAEERRLAYLQREWDQCKAGNCGRAPNFITEEAVRLRKTLATNVGWLGEEYQGVMAERDLGKNCCYGVFEYRHKQLVSEFGQLMGLTADMVSQTNPTN
jgi:hypothetical protein